MLFILSVISFWVFIDTKVLVVSNLRVYKCVSDFRACVWPDGIFWLLLRFLRYEHTGNVYLLYLSRLSEKIHSILIRTNVFHVFLVELFVLSAAVSSLLASVWRITSILQTALWRNVRKTEYSYVKSFVWWRLVGYIYYTQKSVGLLYIHNSWKQRNRGVKGHSYGTIGNTELIVTKRTHVAKDCTEYWQWGQSLHWLAMKENALALKYIQLWNILLLRQKIS